MCLSAYNRDICDGLSRTSLNLESVCNNFIRVSVWYECDVVSEYLFLSGVCDDFAKTKIIRKCWNAFRTQQTECEKYISSKFSFHLLLSVFVHFIVYQSELMVEILIWNKHMCVRCRRSARVAHIQIIRETVWMWELLHCVIASVVLIQLPIGCYRFESICMNSVEHWNW